MNTPRDLIINNVLNLQSFTPSDEVNSVMGALVNEVINTCSTLSVASEDLIKVRQISADTESELEKYWARRIIASETPIDELKIFPYLDNYQELTGREVALVAHSGLSLTHKHKALVIGSGPLPLSAYELHRQTGVHIDHVDSSHEAIKLCEQLMNTLGLSDSKYYEATGETVLLRGVYDLILIAALAGATAADKQKIIDAVMPYLSNNGRIVIRSAKGSRTLLYPGILSEDIKGLSLLKEYHPTDYIINSIFVYGR